MADRKNIKDFVTDAWRMISSDHNSIHKGEGCVADVSKTIATGASSSFILQTPTSDYVHLKDVRFSTDGDKITVVLLEATASTSVTVGTATVTARNTNRNKADNSQVVVYSDPTVDISNVTQIFREYLAGGGSGVRVNANSIGSTGKRDNEVVLDQNKKYIIKADNAGSATATIVSNMFWYEEDGGE